LLSFVQTPRVPGSTNNNECCSEHVDDQREVSPNIMKRIIIFAILFGFGLTAAQNHQYRIKAGVNARLIDK
jgi:hypothetical protein